ncbi:MAG: cold shock domain-containing protein [Reinekea sp.]|jgi:cold shock protein
MKLKSWLIRLGVALVVALVGPIILSGALSLVSALAELSVAELLSLTVTPAKITAYTLSVVVLLLLIVFYQLIVEPLLERHEEDDREEGQVKWFNVSKGFGFVTRENGEDVFVHFRSIRGRGHRSLQEGQRVRFGVVESSKGLQAEDVTIVRKY